MFPWQGQIIKRSHFHKAAMSSSICQARKKDLVMVPPWIAPNSNNLILGQVTQLSRKTLEELSQNNQRKQFNWFLFTNVNCWSAKACGVGKVTGIWKKSLVCKISFCCYEVHGPIGLESLGKNKFPKQCEFHWL